MHRAFTYRLHPTVKQSRAIASSIRLQCELYNASLEERVMTYKWHKRGVSSAKAPTKFDQFRTLTGLFELRPELASFGVTVCRGTLTRLDEAFRGFFSRVEKGQAPGFPRFKSVARFDSLTWCDAKGWRLDEKTRRLYIQGVGHVKLNLHRPLAGTAKTLTIARRGAHLEATVFCAKVPKQLLPATGNMVGLDLGVGVLVAGSDGTLYDHPRHRRRLAPLLKKAQAERSRHTKGSSRHKKATTQIARLKHKEATRRTDALHKLSRLIVNENDLIVVEDLRIANMSRSARGTREHPGRHVAAKSGLNDAVMDSGWRMLIAMITYKAEGAGRTVIKVSPRHTSQRCSICGFVAAANRHRQKFSCLSCGAFAHADVNAARNILRAGLARGGIEARLVNGAGKSLTCAFAQVIVRRALTAAFRRSHSGLSHDRPCEAQ